MITLALIITGLAAWAIAGSLAAIHHDGYRRQPTRPRC
jgi:hypothetical protein